MPHPYQFLEGRSPKFFDEGAELAGEKVDLLGFSLENEDSFGMDERIFTGARDALGDVSSEFVRAILWFADGLLEHILQDINLTTSDGDTLDPSSLDFKRLNQLDFIHLVILTLSKSNIELGDESGNLEAREITPAMFCAAYALRMMFNATRAYLRDSDLRNYYQMQASVAFGLLQALSLSETDSISSAVISSMRRETAKKGATVRWQNDSSRPMWEQVKIEWEAWQADRSLFRYPRDFRRAMQLKFPALVDGTLKNRMSQWARGIT